MDNLILVGFGKQRLVDLIEKINTDKEDELLELALGGKSPPIYRAEQSCTEDQVLAFLEFVGWLNSILRDYNKQEEK